MPESNSEDFTHQYHFDNVLGAFFNVDRSTVCRWVQSFLPILEKALEKEAVLPERQVESIEDFMATFPEIEEIFTDGTERPTQRPGDYDVQKEYYSGKKKGIPIKILSYQMLVVEYWFVVQLDPGKIMIMLFLKNLIPKYRPILLIG